MLQCGNLYQMWVLNFCTDVHWGYGGVCETWEKLELLSFEQGTTYATWSSLRIRSDCV